MKPNFRVELSPLVECAIYLIAVCALLVVVALAVNGWL